MRIKLFAVLLLSISVFSSGQTAPAAMDLVIDGNSYGYKAMPLGMTINNNILVFYDIQINGIIYVKARLVYPNGNMGNIYTLATNVGWGEWQAAWSPEAKRFMLVYIYNDKIYARAVKITGAPKTAAKLIAGYTGDYLQLTWSPKKKFVYFIERNDQVVAQQMRRTAKKYKGEVTLTNVPLGDRAIPTDCATESNGSPVVYYVVFNESTLNADVKMTKLDKNLDIVNNVDVKLNLTAYNEYDVKNLQGACSAGDVHAFCWKYGSDKAKYAIYRSDGTRIKKARNTPHNKEISNIVYDANSNIFRYFYTEFVYDGQMDNERFFSTNFNPNGKVNQPKQVYYLTHGECDGRYLGVSRNGSIIIVWQPELASEVRAHLIN